MARRHLTTFDRRLLATYRECHEAVVRKGIEEPCEKTAVAVRWDPSGEGPYPVCSRHARADMVPLHDLLGGGR